MLTCLIRRLGYWRAGVQCLCSLLGHSGEDSRCFMFIIPVIFWRTAFNGINIFFYITSFYIYKLIFEKWHLVYFSIWLLKRKFDVTIQIICIFFFPVRYFKMNPAAFFVEVHLKIPWYLHGDILNLSFMICDKRNSKTHIIFKRSYIFSLGSI